MKNIKLNRNESGDALLIGLMKNIDDMVFRFEYHPNPRFTYVSPSSTRFVGYTPEEHYTDPAIGNKIIHPDDLEYFLDITGSADPVNQFEIRWIKKDGTIIWTEHKVRKSFDHNQQLIAVEGIIRDVSSRKETEQNLLESKLRYRALFDASNDFVFLHGFDSDDTPGYFTEVNNICCQKLGYTKEEFRKLRPRDIVSQENIAEIQEEAQQIHDKKELIFEKNLIAKNGTVIPVELNARTFEYKGKQVVLSIGRDISHKKESDAFSKIITNAAIDFLEIQTVHEALAYAAATIYKILNENALITITEFDNPNNLWKMVDVKGLNTMIEKACKAFDFDLRTLQGPINTDYLPKLINGKVTELEFDLSSLTNGIISKSASKHLKKILPFNQVYVIALKKNDIIYGTVTLITTKKTKPLNTPLIEAFISQVAMFIEKLQAQQALKASESKYRRMFFDNQSNMLLIDPDTGQIVDANRSALNFYGYTYDEIRKLKIFDINTTNQNIVKQEMLLLMEKKKNVFRFQHRLANKQLRDVEVYSGRFQTTEKTLIYSTIYDITERLKVEEEIKLSEEKFRTVFLTSPDAININRLKDGMYVSVNSGFIRIMGYTEDETIGKTSGELGIWNNKEDRKKLQQGLKEKGVVVNLEAKFRAKNGEFKDGLMSAALMTLDGEPHIISITRDITERKRSDQIHKSLYEISKFSYEDLDLNAFLSKLHEQVSTILNARNFYVSLYDKISDTYTFPYHVDETEEYESLEPIKMEGSITDFVRREGKGKLLASKEKDEVIKAEDIISYGNPAKVWLGAPMISGTSKEVIGVIAIQDYNNKDAYNQKDLEILEIIAFNIGVFIERIQNHTALKEAKEKAEESDRLKSAFLANMSHEIRTPMNGILGFADLLNEPDISEEEQTKYVGIIEKSGERMLNIINDLIDISKIEAGQMELIVSEANINDQIDFLYTFFKPEAEAKNIHLTFVKTLPDELANTITDREKLYAILTNLIKNAIKFTSDGKIEYGYVKKENNIEFFVKDTGMGIARDRQKAIFERFVQADLTISKPYEGAGLGLAITRAYVEMLGGEIWLESDFGIGSAFYFTIPYHAKTHPPKSADITSTAVENYEVLANLNILIAEDDETAFYYLKALLANKCKTLTRTITGSEAVEAVRNNPGLDLLLMDIKMPDMDGYEATEKIRTFNTDVKIIAQTAYALSGDREKALEAGCNEYVAKPVKKDELFSIINNLFTAK